MPLKEGEHLLIGGFTEYLQRSFSNEPNKIFDLSCGGIFHFYVSTVMSEA